MRAFTIIEILIVLLIAGIIFSAILGVFISSDKTWRYGETVQEEQREARRAVDSVTSELRKSSPSWVINNTSYPITINASGERIDFYTPIFNATGNISSLVQNRYWRDAGKRQLLRRQWPGSEEIKANSVEDLQFSFADVDNSAVDIDISIKKESALLQQNRPAYRLQSSATLRNPPATLGNETQVEGSEEEAQ